ncbi:MAG: hypothetical protein GTO62_15310 [Planctomycetales bacterium]|nr:hypothetical protein [Planctomycetales bacterium]NIN78268.1 hypothetical protein [Planctomycetales bacterium]NIP70605.1 hypothetical protein [Planctomycetales bacterium]
MSTRCVRPGALAYRFAPGPRLNQLLDRLRDTRGWGQIIGPHGSGKSTLLHTLWPALGSAGFEPLGFVLRDGQRRLPAGWRREAAGGCGQRRLLVLDGYEQLSWLARWNLQRTCRRRGWGLLITAHQPQGLPMLYRTRTTPPLAQALVQHLLADQPLALPAAEIDASFHRHRGNLRTMFGELFDRYEELRG